jgi:serine O-acetyltransferase
MKRVLTKVYWLLFRVVETLTGISLPKPASIGPGLRIWHFGNRSEHGPVPSIGDNVDFGAYAQVLGGVRIGHGCRIGTMSVVLDDVPDGATAVGSPARIIAPRANQSERS